MPELTASVVDTVIVLSVDILGPEYHTYAVTFPAGQTIEAGREMTLVINLRRSGGVSGGQAGQIVLNDTTGVIKQEEGDTTLVDESAVIAKLGLPQKQGRNISASPAQVLTKRVPEKNMSTKPTTPTTPPSLERHPVLGYRVHPIDIDDKENNFKSKRTKF